jgi:hypothetical protein
VTGVQTCALPIFLSGDDSHSQFGSAVALTPDLALIGAHFDDALGTQAGAAYVFSRDSGGTGVWSSLGKLNASDHDALDRFGETVALGTGSPEGTDGVVALVGAPWANPLGPVGGAVWSFELRKGQGDPCLTSSECASGYCVDGACCDSACGNGDPGDCQACSMAAGSAADGTCGPRQDGAGCTGGTCLAGACHPLAANGTVCSDAAECVSGFCTNDVCCTAASCAPFKCGVAGACLTVCGSSAECMPGYRCASDRSCVSLTGDGAQDEGCSCRAGRRHEAPSSLFVLLAPALLGLLRRRPRRS